MPESSYRSRKIRVGSISYGELVGNDTRMGSWNLRSSDSSQSSIERAVSFLVQDELLNPPEESLDEIFGHIPQHYGQSLQSCSLISKSWQDNISRNNAGLFSRAR